MLQSNDVVFFCVIALVYIGLMPRFQGVYHWDPIMSSIRFLPTGIGAIFIAIMAPNLVKLTSPKWIILGGLTLAFIATMILPFAPKSTDYWSHLLPSFLMWAP